MPLSWGFGLERANVRAEGIEPSWVASPEMVF